MGIKRRVGERVVKAFPGISRACLELSASGRLPRVLYEGCPQSVRKDLFRDGMRLFNAPFRLYAPIEIVEDLREFEPVTQKIFHQSIKAGMTVLDVGANIGYYSLLAGKLAGPSGRVHAVEPCARNLAFLERNIHLNKLQNITIHRYAAGEKARRRKFYVTDISVDHGFYPHPYAKTVQITEVDEKPVDDFVNLPIDIAKIDVEGGEIEVLNGMTSILNSDQLVSLIVEWSPDCMKNAGHDPADLPAHLQKLGFKRIEVLDDLGKQITSTESVLHRLHLGQVPKFWCSNLCAKRK
jgi:FkbM family methyltransferase